MLERDKVSRFERPSESPGFLLWQLSSDWRRQVEAALCPLGLTHPQFVLLANTGWLTKEGANITQADLARQCKTDLTMTSQVLRALEKKGLITRERKEGNERSKFPKVTSKGKALIAKAVPLVEAVDASFFKKLGLKRSAEMLKEVFIYGGDA
jgi:DNA-binding MarR family transcriptional regulator